MQPQITTVNRAQGPRVPDSLKAYQCKLGPADLSRHPTCRIVAMSDLCLAPARGSIHCAFGRAPNRRVTHRPGIGKQTSPSIPRRSRANQFSCFSQPIPLGRPPSPKYRPHPTFPLPYPPHLALLHTPPPPRRSIENCISLPPEGSTATIDEDFASGMHEPVAEP